jgi:hypothetical protein
MIELREPINWEERVIVFGRRRIIERKASSLGYHAAWRMEEPTFRRNVSPPSSG